MAALPARLSQLPLSASQLQHLTNGNTSAFAHRAQQRMAEQSKALFAPPKNIIKPWKAITGGQEWANSSYYYNKNTAKTMPTAQNVTDKLLRDYVTMIEDTGLGPSGKSSAARQATTARRRALDKMYITSSTAKDYGDKIVVNAFVYDAAAGARKAAERKMADRAKARKQSTGPGSRSRGPGVGGSGAAGARRPSGAGPPRRIGLPRAGASSGAPRRFGPPGGSAGTGLPRRINPGEGSTGSAFRTFRPNSAASASGTRPSRSPAVQRTQGPGS